MKTLRAVSVFLVTVLMYLGISWLGWSLPDVLNGFPLFLASPVRLGYCLVVILFGLLIGLQAYHSMEGIQDGKGLEESRVPRQAVVGSLLVGGLFVALFLLPFTSRHNIGVFPENLLLQWFGVLLSGVGYWLIYWSGITLGRQYSAEVVLQKDHRLITSGPYRLVRHPRYLGILCLALGISLLFHTWIGLLVFVPVVGLVVSRIHDEELLLKQAFGLEWQQYTQHSWRLLPPVY